MKEKFGTLAMNLTSGGRRVRHKLRIVKIQKPKLTIGMVNWSILMNPIKN
jgi:hypothetical protein